MEKQRRENERIVERYERLLDRDRSCAGPDDETADSGPERTPPESTGAVARVARFLGL